MFARKVMHGKCIENAVTMDNRRWMMVHGYARGNLSIFLPLNPSHVTLMI